MGRPYRLKLLVRLFRVGCLVEMLGGAVRWEEMGEMVDLLTK